MVAAASHSSSSSPFSRALFSPFDSPLPLQPLFFLCFCCCFVFCTGVLVTLLMRVLGDLSFIARKQRICQRIYHSAVSFLPLLSIPRIPAIPGRQSLNFNTIRLFAWRLPGERIRIFQGSSGSAFAPIPSIPSSAAASSSSSGGRGDPCLHRKCARVSMHLLCSPSP